MKPTLSLLLLISPLLARISLPEDILVLDGDYGYFV